MIKKNYFLISLEILIVINIILTIVVVLFPPELYYYYLKEVDYFYLNYLVVFVVFTDLLALYLGYKIAYYIFPTFTFFKKSKKISIKISIYVGIPLIFSELLVLLFIKNFLQDNQSFIPLILTGLGTSYKENIQTNFYYFSIYILMGVIFWSLSLYKNIGKKITSIKILIIIGILLIIISGILMLARFLVIPFLLGLAVIFLKHQKNISFSRIFLICSFGIIIFILISFFRIHNAENTIISVITQFLGYTVASFNRLALVLDGKLTYTYADTGYYLFPFFSHIPLLHKIIPNIYGVTSMQLKLHVFADVGKSGLDPKYVWATVYGNIFSVLKFYSFIYFFFVGLFIGIIWKGFLNNKIYGIVIYPWIFASIILYFASNIMFLPQFIGLIYAAIFLSVWSLFFKMKGVY
jgi:hypothetical protein